MAKELPPATTPTAAPRPGQTITTREQLAAMPPRSQVLAHWPDGSQADIVVTRTGSGTGAAATDSFMLAGTDRWLDLAVWGAVLTAQYMPGVEATTATVEGAARALYEAAPRSPDAWYISWDDASEGLREDWRLYARALERRSNP